MKHSNASLALFLASTMSKIFMKVATETLKEDSGDGCKSEFNFHSLFVTDADSSCEYCDFCEGSTFNYIFDPRVVN